MPRPVARQSVKRFTGRARILVADIETAPALTYTFGLKTDYIPHDAIYRDAYMICAAWKWVGQKTVYHAAVNPEDAARYQADGEAPPDLETVREFRAAVMRSSCIVAHNGDRFDWPWLVARSIYWRLGPLPHIPQIDTLKAARRARFMSNKLDYLTRHLGGSGKIKTDLDLWKRCCAGDPKALNEMVRYNRKDVTELEEVYMELRPYIKNHPNLALWEDDPAGRCPNCAGDNVRVDRERFHPTRVNRYPAMECRDCGARFRGTNQVGGVNR